MLHEAPSSTMLDSGPASNSSSSRPNRSINELLVIEIFSGSCNLSTAFVKRGFQALAIDYVPSHKFRTLIFDLTLRADQLLLLDIISTQRPFLVWLAPPCGTASRARNIPVQNKYGKSFAEPLRSDIFPDGLPSLENIDLDRVLAANTLYELCENVCRLCDSLQIQWIIENPFDSFFWYTSWISQRHQDFPKILFHNCMYGGLRPKRTGLLANFDISSLAILCDDLHEHAPWRSSTENDIYFHTSEEAAYPQLFCAAVANVLADLAVSQGFSMPPFDLFDTQATNPLHAKHLLRGSVGIQPRGLQFSFLPSSFHDVWITQDKLPTTCLPSQKLPSPFTKGSSFPPELQFDDGSSSRAQFNTSIDDKRKMKVLVPISPKEYLERLSGTDHPCQLNFSAWGWYPTAIDILREKTPGEYLRFQASVLNSILSRAKELASEERKRKFNCDEVVKKVNAKKRLCLFRELLRSIDHPDTEIVDDLETGFKLTGWLRPSNLFPKLSSPPQISTSTLESLGPQLNAAAVYRCERNSSVESAKTLLDITIDELNRGWIVEEVDAINLEEGTILSPRFIIQQGEKSRAIDDFTFSSINSTIGTSEKIVLQGVDEIASLIKHLFTAGIDDLEGRTFDMEAAYRQLAILPSERSKAVICVYDPGLNKVRGFTMATMPFGAISSVYSFLRTAAAINNVGCSLLGLPMSSYFDDFTVVTRSELSKSANLAVTTLFDVLGLNLSTSERKNIDFAKVFNALGVSFDLHKEVGDFFRIRNTDQRICELLGRIDEVPAANKISGKEAKSLRSRLSFASAQIYGRTTASVLKDLGKYEGSKHRVKLNGNTRLLLRIMRGHLESGMARQVSFGKADVVHIFTDGSLEGDADSGLSAGLGAVLVDQHGKCIKAFSYEPTQDDVQVVGGKIHQLEILPVIMSCVAFADDISSKFIYIHVDNVAAQSALINAGSVNHSSRSLVYLFLDFEQRLKFVPWISRVASASNIADGPSRSSMDKVESLGAECFTFPKEVFRFIIQEFIQKLESI